jgi:putative ABC transport system substrate-binding protein
MTILAGAAAYPLLADAQQTVPAVVGFLASDAPGPFAPFLAAFQDGLRETGYVEGKNVTVEYRWAEGHYDRLPGLASDLVGPKVNVIASVGGTPSALAAKNATSTIPIVFSSGNPVESGLVASLARPGGNLTGVSLLGTELIAKRLELLSELGPRATVIGLLVDPDNAITERIIVNAQEAARALGLELRVLKAGTEGEIEAAFASFGKLQTGALDVMPSPFFDSRREEIVALASRNAVPAIYGFREVALAGGLMSYGPSITTVFRQIGIYAGKILKGANPADLPVQQPAKYELVINLKTAKSLGLIIPPLILARADQVIE